MIIEKKNEVETIIRPKNSQKRFESCKGFMAEKNKLVLRKSRRKVLDGKMDSNKEKKLTPEEEFRKAYPKVKIDKKFFRLVGILPEMTLEEEEEQLREIIREKF